MGVTLYVTSCFSFAALKILSSSLIFAILIIMYHDVDTLGSSCLEVSMLPIPISVSFLRLGKFSAIISLNTFSTPFSFSAPSGSPIT